MEDAAISDSGLMRQLAHGHTGALEELYDRYSARAFGLALKICKNRGMAEDAVQNAFFTVLEKHALFDDQRGDFQGWFLSIVRNACIDLLRREGKRLPALVEDLAGGDQSVEEQAEGIRVRQALARLPHKYREVVLLAYFGGYTHRQLAEKLNLPLGTVKSRIRLGLERLSQLLDRGGGSDEM